MIGRRIAIWIAVFLLALAVQSTLAARIAIAGVQPDFVYLALFICALRAGTFPSIFVGFTLGLCQDLYSPAVLGQNALCKTITGAFVGLFNERMMNTDPLVKLVILLLAYVLHDSVYWVVDAAIRGDGAGAVFVHLATQTLPRAVYTMVAGAAWYGWEYLRGPSANN